MGASVALRTAMPFVASSRTMASLESIKIWLSSHQERSVRIVSAASCGDIGGYSSVACHTSR